MRIVPFENQYRDDMIFMVLEAKNALGRIPTLNAIVTRLIRLIYPMRL